MTDRHIVAKSMKSDRCSLRAYLRVAPSTTNARSVRSLSRYFYSLPDRLLELTVLVAIAPVA